MHELRLLCPQDRVEILSDALDALDALSVSVEDADALTDAEQALFGEPGMPAPKAGWRRSCVAALFPDLAQAQAAGKLLAQQDFFATCQWVDCVEVPEQDWVRLTQSQFSPVEITPSFWVVPTWHEVPSQATHVMRLDPGLAFGTGTHPTTRMCLRWLAQRAEAGLGRTLDYGCGSGILAIGAALLGAPNVDAVDIDSAAVQSAVDNAVVNQVSIQVGQPELAHGLYQTVVANILATPLKVLAPLLCAHLQPGASLVLAGILERQWEELALAYEPYVELVVSDRLDGWVLMTATR